MWDTIKTVLTSGNAISVLIFLAFIVISAMLSSKKGLLAVKTGRLRIGSDEKELTIVRNQTQWAYLFLMSLKSKLLAMESPKREDYFVDVVLEKIYDKVVEWITYNHINSSNSYIEIKQSECRCIVYSLPVQEQFKTPEFEARMNSWVKEIILNLINIRKEYSAS